MAKIDLGKIAEKFRKKHNFPEDIMLYEIFNSDPETVEVIIECVFPSPVIYKSFHFEMDNSKVSVEQKHTLIFVNIERRISKKLFECVNELQINSFLIGYLDKIFPEINRNLQEQKYLNGFILGNSYSSLDILFMSITNLKDNKKLPVSLTKSIAPFPPSSSLAKNYNHIFIRDLIDAINYYLNYNLDEAIRKTITSLENFFKQKNVQAKTFRGKLDKCLFKENYPDNWDNYFYVFRHNINIIYKIRNGIVHNKLRLTNQHAIICKKGIFTAFYIYRCGFNDEATRRFVYTINMQTELIEKMIRGMNLDELRSVRSQEPVGPTIDSMTQMDHFYFTGMRISEIEEGSLPLL